MVTAENLQSDDESEEMDSVVEAVAPLHENFQAARDTFFNTVGVRIERRAQNAAKLVRRHFSAFELPNEAQPDTVADVLKKLNIPILDERTGKIPEGWNG